MGHWKDIRFGFKDKLQLYDLSKDPGEKNDVAGANASVVTKIEQIMAQEHTPSKYFPGVDRPKAGGKKKKKKK